MAKALQCDRCGCYFNPLRLVSHQEFSRFMNPAILTSDDMQHNVRGRYLNPELGIEGMIDLCPDCTDAFIKFMGEYKND